VAESIFIFFISVCICICDKKAKRVKYANRKLKTSINHGKGSA